MAKKSDYRVSTVSVISRKTEADSDTNELVEKAGDVGLYCIESMNRQLTAQEWKEFKSQAPIDDFE